MLKKYPCKGCVEKYTKQFNEVEEENTICGMCEEIAKRNAEPRAELSTRQDYERGRLVRQDRVD